MGAVLYPIVRWPLRVSVAGRELLPREGGFVVASNHLSNFDPYVLSYPFFPRQLRYMAKSELFRGVLTPMLYAAGAFPVRRGEGDAEAFKTAVRLVASGEGLVMFPTGTRERTARKRQIELHPHTGAARIALAARAPLLPAAIDGSDGLFRLAQLKLAFGEPDTMEDLRRLPPREAARIATLRLMEAIETLRASFAAR